MKEPAILFVCLGNICRSPMAEGAMREAAEKRGLDIAVDSAGTGGWHAGDPPDTRAQAEAKRHGVDISGPRGRQIAPADHHRFTHIFALDEENLRDILLSAPADGTAEVSLLMDAVPGHEGKPVADPYYGGAEGFARTWDQVSVAAQALADRFAS